MSSSQSLEPSVILYQANQLVDLQLWNGNFCLISLFDIDKYLASDVKNDMCSLLRMAVFIKQCLLGNRTTKNIPQIAEFGLAAWKFITAIYKSR